MMKKVEKLAEEIRGVINTADKAILRMRIRETIDKHAPIEKPFPKPMEFIPHRTSQGMYLALINKDRTGIVFYSENKNMPVGKTLTDPKLGFILKDFKDYEFKKED